MTTALAKPDQKQGAGFWKGKFDTITKRHERVREDAQDTKIELARANGLIDAMAAKMPRIVGTGAVGTMIRSTANGAGAYLGGYLDAMLEESGSDKAGPVKLVPLAGAVVTLGAALFVPNPDLQVTIATFGDALVAGGLSQAGRDKRRQHKAALDIAKQQPAAKK